LATVDKDFKVKNGLVVNNGGSFGGAVVVGTPTDNNHAATKEYVDSLTGSMAVGSTAPNLPTDGTQWLDTLTNRINYYYNGTWYTQATMEDTHNIPDHIHDTAIDGNGLIVSMFVDSGFYNSPMTASTDSGSALDNVFSSTIDGGIAIDNFN